MFVLLLCQRRIVWSVVADRRGNYKHHPVVILTHESEIPDAEYLAGVVCSHSAHSQASRPDTWVELIHHPHGLCITQLKKPTVAICEWGVRLHKQSIREEDLGGLVSPSQFVLLLEKIQLVRQRRAEESARQRRPRFES